MYSPEIDGQLQVIAAASLLDFSRLVRWDSDAATFRDTPHDVFEFAWQTSIDPIFGRLICWINFSAGAEMLAKGVCLLNGIDIRAQTHKMIPITPGVGIPTAQWSAAFRKDYKHFGVQPATDFRTLGPLYQGGEHSLNQLCKDKGATAQEQDVLLASYEFLARAIRNRDAHAYVPKVRDPQHSLVPALFCESFNLLMSWLPGGPSTLNSWRTGAKDFIKSV